MGDRRLTPAPKGDGGDAGSLTVVPSFYHAGRRPDVRIGERINAPFGLKTEYDDDWMGRFVAIESELEPLTRSRPWPTVFSPQAVYRGRDQCAVCRGDVAARC